MHDRTTLGLIHRKVIGDVQCEGEVESVFCLGKDEGTGEVNRVLAIAKRRQHDEVAIRYCRASRAFGQAK